MNNDDYNSKAEYQQFSIWEDIHQQYSPSSRDSNSSDNSIPVTLIEITDTRNTIDSGRNIEGLHQAQ